MNRRIVKKLSARAAPLLPLLGDTRQQFPADHRYGFDQLPGTVMVGSVTGYYEPEWEDEPALSALWNIVYWRFAKIDDIGELAGLERPIHNAKLLFQAANDIIAEGGYSGPLRGMWL